uniref:Cystic fibrosis transmembrane conductance regulator n=1 Tax=Sinocyclocheilus rhinocerous TaxID=307959 RepID=A0A673JJL0_9TELE
MEPIKKDAKSNPSATANLFSQVFFWWLNPLFRIGSKRRLEEDDMYKVLPEDGSKRLGEELQSYWDQEVEKATKELRTPKLTKAIIRCYWRSYAVLGVFTLIEEVIKVIQPVFLGKLIQYFERSEPDNMAALYEAYGYAAGISLSALGLALLHHLYFYHVQRAGMKIRIAMCHMIYKKALCLSATAMGQTTTGQIVNLLSNDVNKFDELTIFLHYLWMGPLQAAAVIGLLWQEVGASCLAGIAVLIFLMPLQTMFGKLFSKYRSKTAAFTDSRIRTMNEVVSGIRIIKMYAWEKPFAALVNDVRRKEISKIMSSSYLRGLNMASFFTANKIILFVTFTVYVLVGNKISASRVFVVVSLYSAIRLTVTLFFPAAIEKVSESVISIRRIKKFLLLDELVKSHVPLTQEDKKEVSVEIQDLICYWDKSIDAPTLQNVSFTVKPGQLLAVIGPVGAGKSSLLSTVLGELPAEKGVVKVKGELTYIYIYIYINFSYFLPKFLVIIKAYILANRKEYLRAVLFDFATYLLLSVGFRAVYQDADIYLLDDPLSAVDAEVGRHLFEQCICGILKDKPRILVTHQLQYLKAANQILVLKEAEPVHTVAEETRTEGTIGLHMYWKYFRAGANVLMLILLVLLNLAQPGFLSWHLCRYAHDQNMLHVSPIGNGDLCILCSSGLTGATVIFGFMRFLIMFNALVNSAETLHNRMFNSILRTPVRFFDINPIGRILNRFAKDIGHLDSLLPWTFVDFIQVFLQIIGVIAVASSVIPWILIPVIPLLIAFLFLRRYFLRTSRDVKRIESTTRSPVFSHLSSSLQGLWTIRAFKAEERFQQTFDAHQDLHSEAWFLFLTTSRWFAVRLDGMCSVFVTITAFGCLLLKDNVGLALSYAVTLMGMFQWGVRQSAEVENLMTSVERVVEYTELESEAPWETQKRPPPDWPNRGLITFDRVNFSYSSDGPVVLKNISAMFRPREKVGIVGRTGAGKSSLISALFRLMEPEGKILVDGVLTSEIGLHDLRQKMSIIPQDPVLFTGTMRKNLDPFSQHSDHDLWNALKEVQLKAAVEELPAKLETELAESGSNFSVGQRQLVCLARAILRKNRILIIDEATANVDPRTDELIQKTIRAKFKECTVLTIAHRLNTIIDSDRILVLDAGRIHEYDAPHVLLQNQNGIFYKMVQQTGKAEAASLLQTAKQAYMNRSPVHQLNGFATTRDGSLVIFETAL